MEYIYITSIPHQGFFLTFGIFCWSHRTSGHKIYGKTGQILMCAMQISKVSMRLSGRSAFIVSKRKDIWYLSKEAIGTQETYLEIVGDAGVKAVKTHCKICKIKAPGCRCPPCRNKNTRLEIAHTALQQNQWWPTSCQQRWPLFRAISFVRCIARCNYIYISIYIFIHIQCSIYK